MRRVNIIARLLLTAIGIYLLVMPLTFLPFLTSTFWIDKPQTIAAKTSIMLVSLFIWFILLHQIWFNENKWTGIIVDKEIQSPLIQPIWAIVGFKLVYFVFGAWLLFLSIPTLFATIVTIIETGRLVSVTIGNGQCTVPFAMVLPRYIGFAAGIIRIILGLYLVTGGWGLLRWQLRRFSR